MKTSFLLHHLIEHSADTKPENRALSFNNSEINYGELNQKIELFSNLLISLNEYSKNRRISIFLEKRFEFIYAAFGASKASNIFIPINPILKKDQVLHILQDSKSEVLVTSFMRLKSLDLELAHFLSLKSIILVDSHIVDKLSSEFLTLNEKLERQNVQLLFWEEICLSGFNSTQAPKNIIDNDPVAIFYTSGSTGKPKGVVLSHRNMVFGAKNVAAYLENNENDRLLAALPLSFDAGFSQLTTAFFVSASVELVNYFFPQDILKSLSNGKITGFTAVPALWIQIAELNWPISITRHLRYFANTGGKMPVEILKKLRTNLPQTKPYLMYGLTESFRSTYLPPEFVDSKPHSIGIPIPNAEILVLNQEGFICKADEPGELIHRGALVGLGYWNDLEKTLSRYKKLPITANARPCEIMLDEIVVFSGDLVKKDADGFLYFIGRNDEMIKTSGYRISPNEIEEVLYTLNFIEEAMITSVPHPKLEQGIIALVKIRPNNSIEVSQYEELILKELAQKIPNYMLPLKIFFSDASLPKNQNGKMDRKKLSDENTNLFTNLNGTTK